MSGGSSIWDVDPEWLSYFELLDMLNEVTKVMIAKVFYLIPGKALKNRLWMVYNDTTINELSIILERSLSVDVYVEHGVEDPDDYVTVFNKANTYMLSAPPGCSIDTCLLVNNADNIHSKHADVHNTTVNDVDNAHCEHADVHDATVNQGDDEHEHKDEGVYVKEVQHEDKNEEEDSENDLEPVEGHTDDDNEELIFVRKKLKARMERLKKLKKGVSEDDSSIDSDYHAEDDQSDDGSCDVDTETDVGCEGVQEEGG